MQRKNRPAIDTSIAPAEGVTRQGQPLANNRAPAPDLSPWISRLYVTKVWTPEDYTVSCGLFSDSSCLRIQLAGQWVAETQNGPVKVDRAAVFSGPLTRRMPISVRGSFISAGIVFRPGACTALRGPRVQDYVDRLVPSQQVGTPSDILVQLLTPEGTPEDWMQALEGRVRQRAILEGWPMPDPTSAKFEEIALRDPGISIKDAAEFCGVERRTLERAVKRDFGMPPKQILRRARALDMAAYLRGVADPADKEAFTLRYYDESHLIREFTDLFGMSPGQFVKTPQPLLTLSLATRQAGRLEALGRLEPGAPPPWQ